MCLQVGDHRCAVHVLRGKKKSLFSFIWRSFNWALPPAHSFKAHHVPILTPSYAWRTIAAPSLQVGEQRQGVEQFAHIRSAHKYHLGLSESWVLSPFLSWCMISVCIWDVYRTHNTFLRMCVGMSPPRITLKRKMYLKCLHLRYSVGNLEIHRHSRHHLQIKVKHISSTPEQSEAPLPS